VLNLADYGRIRIMADRLGVDSIDREGRIVVLKFRPQTKVDPARLVMLVRERTDLTLVPPAGLKLTLDKADGQPHSAPRRGAPAASPPGHGRRGRKTPAPPPSWWTARARETEIKPGFNKAEMTKPTRDDPRAPGGVFERVGGLLSELLGE